VSWCSLHLITIRSMLLQLCMKVRHAFKILVGRPHEKRQH
jgi:hypothetical protein